MKTTISCPECGTSCHIPENKMVEGEHFMECTNPNCENMFTLYVRPKTYMSTDRPFDLEVLKENILQIVEFHKANCHTPHCECSTFMVRMLAEYAGIEFTEEEKQRFS